MNEQEATRLLKEAIENNIEELNKIQTDHMLYGCCAYHIDKETGKITRINPFDPKLNDQKPNNNHTK